jgi:N-acetylmuramoyl-L-alanine amidase
MLRPVRFFLASCSLSLFLANNIPPAVAAPGCLQVLSLVKDAAGSYVVLNTTRSTTLPAPCVHYYPQANGITFMTADFDGVVWNQPPQLLPISEPLKAIRFGQLQSNPPVFRVTIASTSALALTKVCFRSVSGVLVVSWKDLASPPSTSTTQTATASSIQGEDHIGQADIDSHAPIQTAPRWHATADVFKRTNLLKGVNIVLDAGHGGSDPGAQREMIQEKILTLDIVEKLYKELLASGARVTLTRSDDTFVSVQDRVRLSLDAHPDIFLSVHINSLEYNTAIHGIETYYRTGQSLPLAECVHDALVTKLSVPDRGVRNARFYVINHTPIPSVLAEVGFISNPEERSNLAAADYQDKIAGALKDGLVAYLARCQDENIANASKIDSMVPANATSHL